MGQRDHISEIIYELCCHPPAERVHALAAELLGIGAATAVLRSETPWRVAEVMIRRREVGEREGRNGQHAE